MAAACPTLRLSLSHCMGICVIWSALSRVSCSTQVFSLPTKIAVFSLDKTMLLEIFFRLMLLSQHSPTTTIYHCSLTHSTASLVCQNCFKSTDSSAPREVFLICGLVSGCGVKPDSITSYHKASAVRMILPTLYAERMFSKMISGVSI